MMLRWRIEEYDGLDLIGSYSAPGNLSRREMFRILRQLASRHLQPTEIISSNLRNRMRGRTDLLEVHDNNGVFQVGQNPFVTARRIEDNE